MNTEQQKFRVRCLLSQYPQKERKYLCLCLFAICFFIYLCGEIDSVTYKVTDIYGVKITESNNE